MLYVMKVRIELICGSSRGEMKAREPERWLGRKSKRREGGAEVVRGDHLPERGSLCRFF